MDEVWKEVGGATNYEVSSLGGLKNTRTGRTLPGTVTGSGYIRVELSTDEGRTKHWFVHRLVCTTFHGEPPPRYIARHANGLRHDNRAENLSWCSRAEHERLKKRSGQPRQNRVGEKCPHARLTAEGVREMRRLSSQGVTYTELARQFGVAVSTAFKAVLGRTWAHVPDSPAQSDLAGSQ